MQTLLRGTSRLAFRVFLTEAGRLTPFRDSGLFLNEQ